MAEADASTSTGRDPPPGGEETRAGAPPELPAGQIAGLVRLLADEDEKIRRVALEKLGALGERGLDAVREASRSAAVPEVRSAAQQFLRAARREEAVAEWVSLASRPELDLEAGSLLIARSEYPDLDPGRPGRTLDEWAAVLQKRIAALRSPDAVIERISGLLFRELGFRGNREDYYDPRNSYLNLVLERKLGIPISLSAVYLLVARRLGQKIEAVGMPGHFILRYRSGRSSRFLDPFDGGRLWTHQDCVAHLTQQGYRFQEEYLRAVEDREILARMLTNLLGIYHNREDTARTDRVTRMLAALQSDRPASN